MTSAWTERIVVSCLILGTGALINSCSLPQQPPVVVHEGAYDVVVLEPLPGETSARHPAFIEPRVMETILSGIYVQDDERLLQRLLSGRMPPSPVFADDQIAIVSRVLVAALAKATPQQQIAFRLSRPQSQGEETTEGLLYCSEPFLYFTFRQFQGGRPQAAVEKPGRQLPDRTGLGSRRLVFQLSADAATGRAPLAENRSPTTLAVNYLQIQRWLAFRGTEDVSTVGRLSSSPPTAAEKSGSEREEHAPAMRSTPSLNELIVRKDLEIESLKEEMRTLRHAFEVQQGEVHRLKRLLQEKTRQP